MIFIVHFLQVWCLILTKSRLLYKFLHILICSDKPGVHDFNVLKKLVLPDGSILRARYAGRPTRDCLFSDPVMDGKRYIYTNTHSSLAYPVCPLLIYLTKNTNSFTLGQSSENMEPEQFVCCCRSIQLSGSWKLDLVSRRNFTCSHNR